MRPFFSPAIALMGRLNYTGKFALLSLISMIAFAVVSYNLFVSLNQVISASQLELQGIALIKPISRTAQLLQQHRGLSAVFIGGYDTLHDRRAAKEKEVAEAFNALERKLPSSLAASADWQHIKANWERLRKEGVNLPVADNLDAHTRLLDQLLLFERNAADEYMLTLDSDISTFYLIDAVLNELPDLYEHMGQIRASGTDILVKRRITEQQKLTMQHITAKLDVELLSIRTKWLLNF